MEEDFNYLLSLPQVPPQHLTKEPILKFDYFEFKDNSTYQPKLLRILLNSINIFNYAYDKYGKQSESLPISIQKVKDENDNLSLIMHTMTNADILNEVLAYGMDLFSDFDETMKKKIDIKFEIDLDNPNKPPEEIHRNYMDGLLYENNCIKKFLSYFEDKEITILPNLFFYIKSNYVEQISKSIDLDCADLITQINHPKTRGFLGNGYNEIDLLFRLNELKYIKVFKNDFTLVNSLINNQLQNNDNLTFENNNIFSLEIKLNSGDISNIGIQKTYNKANLLRDSLINQGYIKEKCNIKVINVANFSKNKIFQYSKRLEKKNIDIFLFFGDISINHTSLFSMNKRIESLESSNKNFTAENSSQNKRMDELAKEISTLKEVIEKQSKENSSLKFELEGIKKSINQFAKSETKNGFSENEKSIQKKKRAIDARTQIFTLFENYQNDLKNETFQLEVEKVLLGLLDQ